MNHALYRLKCDDAPLHDELLVLPESKITWPRFCAMIVIGLLAVPELHSVTTKLPGPTPSLP